MTPSRVGAALGLLAAGLLIGSLLGWRVASDHRDAAEARQAQLGRTEYVKAADDGASAVASFQATAGALAAHHSALDLELTHDLRTPLVLVSGRCPAAGARAVPARGVAVGPGAVGRPPAQDGATAALRAPAGEPGTAIVTAATAPMDDPAVADDAGLQLSLGAVRLWNSALVGQPRPAGLAGDTCTADDPGAPACAAPAGISLRQLWRNHNANASLCAQDRAQLDELIALLERRQRATP